MKLQDAYVAEAGQYIGNWAKIGYTMQASNNFDYTDANASGWDNNTTAIPSNATEVWQASAKAKLNDCSSGVWKINAKKQNSDSDPVEYSSTASSSECQMLTPVFDQLTKGKLTVASGS